MSGKNFYEGIARYKAAHNILSKPSKSNVSAGIKAVMELEFIQLKDGFISYLKQMDSKGIDPDPIDILKDFNITENKFNQILFSLIAEGKLVETSQGYELKE